MFPTMAHNHSSGSQLWEAWTESFDQGIPSYWEAYSVLIIPPCLVHSLTLIQTPLFGA